MKKLRRLCRYFIAFVLSVIAFIIGGRFNYELIKYLGGQYGIMTEFYSDWAYLTHHKFNEFRNATLIHAVLSIFLLTMIYKRSKSSKSPLVASLLFFAIGCVISYFIISPPNQITHFIIGRACCFVLYIIAAYIIINKPKTQL